VIIEAVLMLSLFGCRTVDPAEAPPTIEGVSQQITFDSVTRMGAHHATASIHREELREGVLSSESTEAIDIAWNSSESFHFQRLVDGSLTFEAIVHEGKSAHRDGRGPWRSEYDGEGARTDVYTAWNAWDEALAGFKDRVDFEDLGATVVDGRPARRFSVSLLPEVKTSKRVRHSKRMRPQHLEGEVILDMATAVRLRAQVKAVEKQGTVRRRTTLTISRSGLGEIQGIQAPETSLGTAGSLLKKLPKRPTPH
jgi:hypothetical protein